MTAAAFPTKRGSESESWYRSLLADFEAAYLKMKNSSEDVNAVFTDAIGGLAPADIKPRMANAAGAYDDARQEFLKAAAKLNEFVISEIPCVHI
jgi:hypothetical protein